MTGIQGRLAAALAIVFTLLAAPAVAEDGIHDRRSISVTGQGEAAGTPDMATINIGVQTQAPAALEAANQNQAIVDRVMQALGNLGIDDKDLQTADYSIWPEQQHDPREANQMKITGYRVNNSIHVTVRDIDKVGEILGAATGAGANSVNGISFGIDDPSALEAEAREAAMQDARARAEDLADLAGVELGEVLQVSLSTGGGIPIPYRAARMEAMDASMAPDISAGQLTVNVQVQVSYAIR